MRSKERENEQTEQEKNFESGYSETEQAFDVEVRAGEWKRLKNFKTYKNRTRQGKILVTYQAVSNRLNQLVEAYYKLVADNPHQGQKLLKELKELRAIQEILLNCLVWEPKGELEENMVPKEVWELIE